MNGSGMTGQVRLSKQQLQKVDAVGLGGWPERAPEPFAQPGSVSFTSAK
jgi:hypothetical protein